MSKKLKLKEMAIHSSTIAWKIPWTEEPGRLQSMGLQRVRHDCATSLTHSWSPARSSRTNNRKRCPFHHRGLDYKSRKLRDTWSNRPVWSWCTKSSRVKANRVLPTERTGQTPSSHNTREDSTHGHHQMVNTKITLIIFFAAKDGETLYSQQKQVWELTVAQIMNSLLPNSDLNWKK